MRTKSPLRKITKTAPSGPIGVMHDHLDCGHSLVHRGDEPAVYRRRCYLCRLATADQEKTE